MSGLCFFLCACAGLEARVDRAHELLNAGNLKPKIILTDGFELFSASRVLQENVQENPQTLVIFIEGDGFAWQNIYTPSDDPTPKNPAALEMASSLKDLDAVYLARPCQYIRDKKCEMKYWTSQRFDPLILQSFDEAVNDIKDRYKPEKIILAGYSGGAFIAMRLAAHRQDVAAVYTFAGVLDPDVWTDYHGISRLAKIPPHLFLNPAVRYVHTCGLADDVVPCELIHKFINNHPEARQKLIEIPDADHEDITRKAVYILNHQET